MNVDEARIGVEKQMLAQADSVGELLEQFRSRIPTALIDGAGWDMLVERSSELPISLSTTGFGFELHMHEATPRADLGLTLYLGTQSAAHFEEWSRSRPEDESARAIIDLLNEMGGEESALHRITGAKFLLEYDIDPAHPGPFPGPGIFLYPNDDVLTGHHGRSVATTGGVGLAQEFEDLGVIVEAVMAACGFVPQGSELRQAEKVLAALPPGAHMGSVGSFPDRARGLRLGITGIRSVGELTSFLERTDWPGQPEGFASFVGDLEERGAFAHLGVHLHIEGGELRPELGVSFYIEGGQWVRETEPWMGVLDGLSASELAVPEKLRALSQSWAGTETVFGRQGVFLVVKGIHHIKMTMVGDRFKEVKAYVFCLMFPSFLSVAASDAATLRNE